MKRTFSIFFFLLLTGASPALAQPANDMQASPTALEVGTTTGSNIGATREDYEVAHAGVRAKHSLWFSWTAPRDGFAEINTDGSSFDTILAVYVPVEGGWLGDIASNDNTVGTASKVRWNTWANQKYLVVLDGRSEGTFSMQFSFSEPPPPPPPLDDVFSCRYYSWNTVPYNSWKQRAVLGSGNFQLDIPAARSNREDGDPSYGVGRTLWFSWIAPDSGRLVIHAETSESQAQGTHRLDPLLVAYEVNSEGRVLSQWNDDWNLDSSDAALVLDVRAGQEYAFLLDSAVPLFNSPCARLSGLLISPDQPPDLPVPTPGWYAAPRGTIPVTSVQNDARLFFRQTAYSTYSCALNNGPWEPCSSGMVLKDLSLGAHRVRLRESRFGLQSEISRDWQFVPRPIRLNRAPRQSTRPLIVFKLGTFPGAILSCKLDGKPWSRCGSTVTLSKLRPGRHRFFARQQVGRYSSKVEHSFRVVSNE